MINETKMHRNNEAMNRKLGISTSIISTRDYNLNNPSTPSLTSSDYMLIMESSNMFPAIRNGITDRNKMLNHIRRTLLRSNLMMTGTHGNSFITLKVINDERALTCVTAVEGNGQIKDGYAICKFGCNTHYMEYRVKFGAELDVFGKPLLYALTSANQRILIDVGTGTSKIFKAKEFLKYDYLHDEELEVLHKFSNGFIKTNNVAFSYTL